MAEIAKLVKPSASTAVGSLDRAAFDRSVALLVDVGLLSASVGFDEVVTTTVYQAATQ